MAQQKAFKLGSIGSPCCCAAGCNVTFCVGNICCAHGAVGAGTIVTVLSGATVIAMGTTGSNGCVTLDIGSAGTYTVKIQFLGSPTVITHTNQALTCGQTKTYTDNPGQYFCCSCCLLSDANVVGASGLMLTDSNGTYNMSYRAVSQCGICSGAGTGTWSTEYDLPGVNVVSFTNTPPITNCAIVTGSTRVRYCCVCAASGANWTFTVTRCWTIDWCDIAGTHSCHLPAVSYGYTKVGQAGTCVDGGSATKTLNIPADVTCNPFTWSSSLPTVGTPNMPDPIGGTVAVQN